MNMTSAANSVFGGGITWTVLEKGRDPPLAGGDVRKWWSRRQLRWRPAANSVFGGGITWTVLEKGRDPPLAGGDVPKMLDCCGLDKGVCGELRLEILDISGKPLEGVDFVNALLGGLRDGVMKLRVTQVRSGPNLLMNKNVSQKGTSPSGKNVHVGDLKRKKMKYHSYQNLIWSSFCKAEHELWGVDSAEVYFADGYKKAKKLKFLNCWMTQTRSHRLSSNKINDIEDMINTVLKEY
uniref:Putative treslin n=1 Tax=Tanacetum cinerariifolium TaxID=118510 RepID=A0A6L2MKA3_TANCI|nr:putative treslin [Tanacetum cinerariifolium]